MRSRQDSGFTLLEICVAIAIFAIGVLPSLSVLVPAVRWGAEAKTDFTAAEAALSAAEFLQAGGDLGTDCLYLGANSTNDFYPFAVHASVAKIAAKSSADVTLKVYRRLLDPEKDNGAYQGLSAVNATNVVSSGSPAQPTVIFETRVKLYRP